MPNQATIDSNRVHTFVSWSTPAGNRRSAPLYVATVTNPYLGRVRELKAKSADELELKVNECVAKWRDQESRKRTVTAQKDAKERARAEAIRLDVEAKRALNELKALLNDTLAVDDRINWESEHDTRTYPEFFYPEPPKRPSPGELSLPPEPGWAWLFRGRHRRWVSECEETRTIFEEAESSAKQSWEKAVQEHKAARDSAYKDHQEKRAAFLAGQREFNNAISALRERFEANEPRAIIEYCSRVLERSSYPETISVRHDLDFEGESGTLVVNLELPSADDLPKASGYKYVVKGNLPTPVELKAKERERLHAEVLDQVVVRTMHEVFESCYTSGVQRVIVNGWVTSLNKATGQDERSQVRCLASDRGAFESINLSRVEPAACVKMLSENVGGMSGAAR